MSTPPRRPPPPSHPPVSYPMSPVTEAVYRPVSPPKTPPRARRPSFSNTISWLARSPASVKEQAPPAPAPYAPSKPVRISEPRFANALDLMIAPRTGPLGSGATVVRTPYDALAPHAWADYDDFGAVRPPRTLLDARSTQPLERPSSRLSASKSTPDLPLKTSSLTRSRSRPTRPPPPIPETSTVIPPAPRAPSSLALAQPSPSTLRPSLKRQSPPSSEYFPPVPPLPANIHSAPPLPPFAPILVSPLPAAIDRSKIIVSLETSTVTHRTTLGTLTARPSRLGRWLQDIIKEEAGAESTPTRDTDDAASICSRASDASGMWSLYHQHLTTAGLLPSSSSSIRVFLDRPSAPYAHILTYLRTPATADSPAVLPRAAQLTSTSSSRAEALLELRDEAAYLGLDELHRLCCDELHGRIRPRKLSHSSSYSSHLHTRTYSQGSVNLLFNAGATTSSLSRTTALSGLGSSSGSSSGHTRVDSGDSGESCVPSLHNFPMDSVAESDDTSESVKESDTDADTDMDFDRNPRQRDSMMTISTAATISAPISASSPGASSTPGTPAGPRPLLQTHDQAHLSAIISSPVPATSLTSPPTSTTTVPRPGASVRTSSLRDQPGGIFSGTFAYRTASPQPALPPPTTALPPLPPMPLSPGTPETPSTPGSATVAPGLQQRFTIGRTRSDTRTLYQTLKPRPAAQWI